MNHDQEPPDSAFDLRARAELALAYDPGDPPSHLLRRTPLLARRGLQRGIAALLLLGAGTGGVLAMRPPELVRGAIEHEYYERTLRGNFMDAKPLLQHLGLTFFEKGGMVTVFAFDAPVSMREGSGWWGNVYWQVVTSRDGKPPVMVSQQKKALAVARASFGNTANAPG